MGNNNSHCVVVLTQDNFEKLAAPKEFGTQPPVIELSFLRLGRGRLRCQARIVGQSTAWSKTTRRPTVDVTSGI